MANEETLGATEMTDLLREVAAELEVDLTNAGPDTELEALGMDSLTQLELITALEDKSGLRIPDEKIGEIKTVSDVVDSLLDLQRSQTGQEASRQGAHD